ncbi:MAG: DbpA RNA binding domain-containing protein [Pirellulaceae bacterium]
MAILHLDALPPKTTKGTIVRLLEQVGGLDRGRVGTIQNHGRAATVEVPDRSIDKLVSALDGTPLGTQHIRASAETAAASTGRGSFPAVDPAAGDGSRRRSRAGFAVDPSLDAGRSRADRHESRGLDDSRQRRGLGGRVLITLGKRDMNRSLPWTRLGVGSPVLLSEQESQDGEGWRAIVCGRSSDSVQLALERWPEPQGEPARVSDRLGQRRGGSESSTPSFAAGGRGGRRSAVAASRLLAGNETSAHTGAQPRRSSRSTRG